MSIILKASGLKKEFIDTVIFSGLDLSLQEGEKAGLIGVNGAGKTTLMKCLMGQMEASDGSVWLAPGHRIGYVEQIPQFSPQTTLWEAVLSGFRDILDLRESIAQMEDEMSLLEGASLQALMKKYGAAVSEYENADGFSLENQARRVLLGLGFTEAEFNRSFGSFSGGEKTKITLACLLAREHSLLFLDEPTNHLDLASIEWLEDYLLASKAAILVISHDRYFLDRITQTTFNLENGRLKRYSGNYSRFMEQKALEDLSQQRAYEKQQQEIQALTDYVNKYRAGIKSKQARGRQSRLERIERIEKVYQAKEITLNADKLHTERSGDKVLTLDRVRFGYENTPLFSNIEAEIRSGQRVALIGANGSGKTTLLRLILNQLQPQAGHIVWGANVRPGYFDQAHANLNPANTVLEEVLSAYPLTLQEARDHLAAVLFTGDDIEKPVASLSGGERARLAFLKLYLAKANFLILDEPTNHMDIHSREIFESFVRGYPGTVLMVSHDRYFLDAVADLVWELEDQQLHIYGGNFSYYKERKARLSSPLSLPKMKPPSVPSTNKSERVAKAESRSQRAKLRQRLAEIEKEIVEQEAALEALQARIADGSLYQEAPEKIKEILNEYDLLEKRIPALYEEWETLTTESTEST